jgi:glutamate dehydrogenase
MTATLGPWAEAFDAELRLLGATEAAWTRRERFLSSLPPGYVEETTPADAVCDLVELSELAPPGYPVDGSSTDGGPEGRSPEGGRPAGQGDFGRLVLRPCRPGAPGDFRLRRAGGQLVELSSLLPVLESFGLAALEAVPWHFHFGGEPADVHVDDIGLRVSTPVTGAGFDLAKDGPRLVAALGAALAGETEISALNRLVVGAGLGWQEVNLLSAYRCYRRIIAGPRAAERSEVLGETLVAFPAASAAAVALFSALLVPSSRSSVPAARDAVQEALAGVPDLERDEVLRELVALIEATIRTSWGLGVPTISLKFASAAVPFLPAPRPLAETFVWAPWFAGLHLRFGAVARGGIRWSDKPADLRAEVLELARAQVKKNSIIVPTGAKGAFALLRAAEDADRQGKEAYCALVRGLLDITDNIVDGRVVHPAGVICRDGDDPYLVVAPDKGTAHFSDLANEISAERGFWLGDAFASGGKNGYDHKALGITAKGAWAAVRRHFRALGIDVQREPVRAVGIGDMSGDVFGNGMLQSHCVRLLAAFDHRHIFVDPSPDPEVSFKERLRLSRLAGSSWQDYDLSVASPGAAVYSRYVKQVELSPEARSALGCRTLTISPPELIRVALASPVDLLFFGGVGTFVKAPDESDFDINDHPNDDVRVSADQLRARVVAEGANLGLTQRARASYSRRGGRVNADFVDNAAGVAISDREVNLKILLGLAVSAGQLEPSRREEALTGAEEELVAAVLAQVDQGIVALERAVSSSVVELPAYEALLRDLEAAGLLDRAVEALPSDDELATRSSAGAGLSRPELAVLLAYSRSELARAIEGSELSEAEAFAPLVLRYFPPAVRASFSGLFPVHPLAKRLAASELANEVIARMGATWAHEVAAETGRELWEVAGAYWAAREVLAVGELLDELDQLAWSLSAEAEAVLGGLPSAALGRLARSYVARPGHFDAGETIASDRSAALALAEGLGPGDLQTDKLVGTGVPMGTATRVAQLTQLALAGRLAAIARSARRDLGAAQGALKVIEAKLGFAELRVSLEPTARSDQWERAQRHLLSDDLDAIAAEAAVRALEASPAEAGADAVEHWLGARSSQFERARALIDGLRAAATGRAAVQDLALLSLIVRALGQAVRLG